jgi:hypothetical protein
MLAAGGRDEEDKEEGGGAASIVGNGANTESPTAEGCRLATSLRNLLTVDMS